MNTQTKVESNNQNWPNVCIPLYLSTLTFLPEKGKVIEQERIVAALFMDFIISWIYKNLIHYLDFLCFIKSSTWLLWQTNFLNFTLKDVLNMLNMQQSTLGQLGQPWCKGSLQRLTHVGVS